MSNSKPCNMHYNNTGILQTFFNPVHAQHTTDTALVQFHALLLFYCFLSIRAPYIYFSVSSICPSLSMLHHLMSVHPSITLSLYFTPFRGCTVPFPPWIRPSPVCLCRDHILCLIFNVTMMQLQLPAFPQHNWLLGSFHSLFCSLQQACMRSGWEKKYEWNSQIACDCDSQLMY